MTLYLNSQNEIKDVGHTTNTSLIAVEVDDANNPFKDWSVAKICCYKVTVEGGIITMFTPYVDTKIIEHIDNLSQKYADLLENVTDTQMALCEVYEMLT